MIELLWVNDPSEAQNQSTRSTLLWERWAARETKRSSFCICLRPANPNAIAEAPFPSWEYRPAYLPDPLLMHIGEAGIEEPMWGIHEPHEARSASPLVHPASYRKSAK
jgi:hypothetical protein